MAHLNSMKQIGMKNMGFRVDLMEWSNKMDLIAFGNEKGEVIVQRLNWQKICTFATPGENIKVRALSWQPDEKILAVGYSNGKIILFDVEKEDEISSFQCNSDIKTMNWTKNCISLNGSESYDSTTKIDHGNFLAPLPNLSVLSSTARKTDYNSAKTFAKGSPNFLVVSLTSGEIFLSVFGFLSCGTINILEHIENPNNYEVCDVRMSSNFDEVFIFVRDMDFLKLLVFQNDVLSKYTSPLLNLAMQHGHILETLNYINDTIQCIIEAWETVLLEMDNKLTKYANSQPEGSVSADFLELLMFGYPSEALEQFLTRDLTEKGLKKLGNSIELSYSTIQNLVIKPLHSAAISLFYHLNVLKGLSRNSYCYRALVTVDATEDAISSAGAFLVKILELQQTIDQSLSDYKIFWCWLYAAIVRLMDETVPDEVALVTQEDITYLAEFLNTFDDCIFEKDDGTVGKRKFNLERVGQYLEDNDLQFPPKFDGHHQWNKLLEDNECLRESGLIYPHQKNYSLIQQQGLLKKKIAELFAKPDKIIEENFVLRKCFKCSNIINPNHRFHTTYFVDKKNHSDMLVATISNKEIIFIESQSKNKVFKSARLQLSEGPFNQNRFGCFGDIDLMHLQFYNETILSILLQGKNNDKTSSYFLQLPLTSIRNKCAIHKSIEILDLGVVAVQHYILDLLEPNCLKPIDGIKCSIIAVSGSRKVASVLSDNCRKVRIYEMEVEDDEDEAEMSQNTTLDNSKESAQSQDY